MSIYHLPQGQYGYKGHVINMPQDLSVFATSLPRLPSELDVMIVRKKGSNNTHRDFRVRKMVVQRALQWLKRNNKYYRNIDIDVSVLSQLPEDGDLTDKCGVGIEDTAEKQEDEELPSEDTDPADVATFILKTRSCPGQRMEVYPSMSSRLRDTFPVLFKRSFPRVKLIS